MTKLLGAGLTLVALAVLILILRMTLWSTRPDPGVLTVNGRVEGDQSAVGAKIGGKVVRLPVHEGDYLEVGAVIAELASEQVQAQLEQAEHVVHTAREQLIAAQARMGSARSQVESAQTVVRLAEQESHAWIGEAQAAHETARARLRQAEADLEKATKDYARYKELFARKVIAAQQLDAAKATHDVARAGMEAAQEHVTQTEQTVQRALASRINVEYRRQEVEIARGRLTEARAAVETARAQLQTAAASMKLAQANLDDTRVLAPFAGTVLRKFVEAGEVVTAGTPLISFVDLSKLYAKVYIAEEALGKVKLGDAGRVYTDAYPKRYFESTVSRISQQAEFTPRDVHMPDERVKLVFAVNLAISNPQGILKPGMPVDARIRWAPQATWGDGMD